MQRWPARQNLLTFYFAGMPSTPFHPRKTGTGRVPQLSIRSIRRGRAGGITAPLRHEISREPWRSTQMAGMVLACAPSFRRDANPDKRHFLDFISFAGHALHSGAMARNPTSASGWQGGSRIPAPHHPLPCGRRQGRCGPLNRSRTGRPDGRPGLPPPTVRDRHRG